MSDQNGSKTIAFGAAHTHAVHIGEHHPGRRSTCKLTVGKQLFVIGAVLRERKKYHERLFT